MNTPPSGVTSLDLSVYLCSPRGECDTGLVLGFKQFMLRWGTELNWQPHYSFMAVLWFSNVCGDQVWHTVLWWNGEMLLEVKWLLSYLPVRNKRRGAETCHGWFVWPRQVAATSCQKPLHAFFGFTKRRVRHSVCQRSICHFQQELIDTVSAWPSQ